MNAHNILLSKITLLQGLVTDYDSFIEDYKARLKQNVSSVLKTWILGKLADASEKREAALNQIIGMREAADIINSHGQQGDSN